MEQHEYDDLARREHFYFWNIGRREILKEALLRHLVPSSECRVFDVGCGPGGNILILKEFGRVSGLDVSDDAFRFARNRGFENLIKAGAEAMPVEDQSFDLVSSLDVFEHVKDDERAIRECFRILKNGGHLLVTVPAHRWLWSRHDEFQHHFRRYAKKDLISKLRRAGFRVLEESHFVTPAVPINFVRKIVDKIFPPRGQILKSYDIEFPQSLNRILLFILRCEKFLIRFISIPFGSSFMVIAKKP